MRHKLWGPLLAVHRPMNTRPPIPTCAGARQLQRDSPPLAEAQQVDLVGVPPAQRAQRAQQLSQRTHRDGQRRRAALLPWATLRGGQRQGEG